mmetsp:Transcript_4193/g.6288  ORF Transcript_4193/g.6288 Transcript_4193/m.6288 type:complete len:582 (-) Transcript_4193:138-1883(-)
MIEYSNGAYNLNLLLRVSGSPLYKSIIPSLIGVVIYILIHLIWRESDPMDDLNHPYAVGVLVSSVSFLIIFRANYGYQRYWEACGAIHHFMSKWQDAVQHTGVFHMQCKHYDSIKPPNYFDHPDLNKLNLTRDREKRRSSSLTKSELKSRRVLKSIEVVDSFSNEEVVPPQSKSLRQSRLAYTPSRLLGQGRLDGGWGLLYENDEGKSLLESGGDNDPAAEAFPSRNNAGGGFASTENGRTPSLFLQELAHLSSLCSAVALATLRNDIEGSESPLDTYHPGEPWPEADPTKLPRSQSDTNEYASRQGYIRGLQYWLGMDRTPEMRTKYNASRPLLVIGGVSENEIAFLQRAKGPSAKVTLAWNWLSEFIMREHLAGSLGKIGPPIVSRIIQFLSDGMIFYNHARKIMYIPFPFPHAQLSAFFVLVMVVAVPFMMDQYTNEVWLGAILTFLTVTCLVGLHEVARELENPFRNIPNELPLCTLQAMFNESLITMFAGYHPDHYWDPALFESRLLAMMAEEEDEVSKQLSFDDVEPTVGDNIQTLQDTMDKQRQEIQDLRRMLESEIDEASETQSDLLENVDIS